MADSDMMSLEQIDELETWADETLICEASRPLAKLCTTARAYHAAAEVIAELEAVNDRIRFATPSEAKQAARIAELEADNMQLRDALDFERSLTQDCDT